MSMVVSILEWRLFHMMKPSKSNETWFSQRINPVYPFDRRDFGVYVFNKVHTNHLTTAAFLLIAAAAYFASLSTDPANFIRLDSLFFPCLAFIIGLLLIWRNMWTYSIVLNYPRFRYEYYIGEQIMSVGPMVDAFIRLQVLFAGEEDMFYKIVVGATNAPELDITKLSENGDLYRKMAKRLAKTLNLNYFDIMDLSHLHECRHVTSRHVRTIEGSAVDLGTVMEEEIQQEYLTRKVDRFRKWGHNPLEICEEFSEDANWPFLGLKSENFGVPLEAVVKLKEEKGSKETWSWRLEELTKKVKDCFESIRVGFRGKALHGSHHEILPITSGRKHSEEDELDEKEKIDLVQEFEDIENRIKWRSKTRLFLRLRTNTVCRVDPLSVEQRTMMELVAKFMALRNRLRLLGEASPGITKDLSFIGMYTAHREYPAYYRAAYEEIAPSRKSWCPAFSKPSTRQVHPLIYTPSGNERYSKHGKICSCLVDPKIHSCVPKENVSVVSPKEIALFDAEFPQKRGTEVSVIPNSSVKNNEASTGDSKVSPAETALSVLESTETPPVVKTVIDIPVDIAEENLRREDLSRQDNPGN